MSRLHVDPSIKRTGDFGTVNCNRHCFWFDSCLHSGYNYIFFRSTALATDPADSPLPHNINTIPTVPTLSSPHVATVADFVTPYSFQVGITEYSIVTCPQCVSPTLELLNLIVIDYNLHILASVSGQRTFKRPHLLIYTHTPITFCLHANYRFLCLRIISIQR